MSAAIAATRTIVNLSEVADDQGDRKQAREREAAGAALFVLSADSVWAERVWADSSGLTGIADDC